MKLYTKKEQKIINQMEHRIGKSQERLTDLMAVARQHPEHTDHAIELLRSQGIVIEQLIEQLKLSKPVTVHADQLHLFINDEAAS